MVDVQRGGPSTGLPTKVEQGDLLSTIFGMPGDAPKIVMAPATIEDCFYSVITARKIAETFRSLVVVLSDANLATGQQAFLRPKFRKEWLAPPIDQSPLPKGTKPYDWDETTGLSTRSIPGQLNGRYTLTGLAHTGAGCSGIRVRRESGRVSLSQPQTCCIPEDPEDSRRFSEIPRETC